MDAALDCEVRDCFNLLVVELAQHRVFILVLAIALVYIAWRSLLIRVLATGRMVEI